MNDLLTRAHITDVTARAGALAANANSGEVTAALTALVELVEAQQAVANAEVDAHERQVARLASQRNAALASVARVRDFATAMAAESPKPGPGGFIAESIIEVLDQQ